MAELPAGTVTFLFTDIEGSTRLLKRLGVQYEHALQTHDRILRGAIDAAGGNVVDTQGDAIFAAFPRAGAALAAATAAQRMLSDTPWPDDETLRVRMGIHTGEPAVGGQRYIGLGVNRASRICSAAHGGQVLVSGVTRDLVEDELPNDVRLVDLGAHRLKDLDRPEHLFQLTVDGLPGEFPPPRADHDTAAVGVAESALRRWGRRRRARMVAALVAVAAVGVPIVVFLGQGSSHVAGVSADSLAFIGAGTGRVENDVQVDERPTSVGYGGGAIWSANSQSGTVSRIDPVSHTVRQTVSVGSDPEGIAVGGGGVWVANHDDNSVSWISPDSNMVVRTIRVGVGPTAVAFGFGSVWVTNADERTLSRIDGRTGRVVATVRAGAAGRGVAVGGGYVWVTDEASGSVIQIDPTTNSIVSRATVGSGPTGIAYGNGSVWVANSLDGTVSRVDATTLAVRATVAVAGGPSAVAFEDGSVWVSAEFANRLVRIDPRRETVVGETAIGNRPTGVAAGAGGVWVAVQASGKGHRGGRLVVLTGPLDSIDPQLGGLRAASQIQSLAYDGLVGTRRVGGSAGTQLVPDLAVALPLPTNGGTSYTFRIRRGIRYSDGRPLRATDFRRAAERYLRLDNDAAQSFRVLVGASRCVARRPCSLAQGVVIQGPWTVTFRLTKPDPRFFWALEFLSPIPPGVPPHDVGTKPVPSTGPYSIESYVPGKLVTLMRNPYFRVWSPGARPDGYPDEIVWPVETSPDRAVDEVLAGKADLLSADVPPARVAELAAHHPKQLHPLAQNATMFLSLNVRLPPFDDVRVRRAIAYAVDRKRIASLQGGGLLAQPTCQLVPPRIPGYKRFCTYTLDPGPEGEWKAPNRAKAHALIAASGTRGQRVVVWSFGKFKPVGAYIVSVLRQLGYPARLHYVPDIAEYFTSWFKQSVTVQAGVMGWFGQRLSSDGILPLRCHDPSNLAHFCDRRIDLQLARLTREQPLDPAGTVEQAARLDRELVAQAPWVPLFNPRLGDLTSARLGNFQSNPWSDELIDQMWVR